MFDALFYAMYIKHYPFMFMHFNLTIGAIVLFDFRPYIYN